MEEPGISTVPAPQWAVLQVVAGRSAGTLIRVASELRIGRGEPGEGGLGGDPALSRVHAVVRRAPDGSLTIEDAGSTNGTYVNDARIAGPRRLSSGDTVRVGQTTLQVASPPRLVGEGDAHQTMVLQTGQDRPGGPADAASLDRARRLFDDGDLEASLGIYRALIAAGAELGPAYQGAGYISFLRKDYADADRMLAASLEVQPSNPNALYLRGLVAAATGNADAARTFYMQALAIDPGHARARDALQQQDRDRQAQPTAAASGAPAETLAGGQLGGFQFGVYEFLRQDGSAISRQALELIDALNIEVRPRFPAYVGRSLRGLLRPLFVVLFSVATAGIYPLIGYIRVKCTRIKIAQGRLQVEKGVFSKHLKNIDLWRVRNIDLERTFVNRMTGDGTLILTLIAEPIASKSRRRERKRPEQFVYVTGLAKGSRLETTFQQLLNLTFLLRGNPVVKGIIQ